VRKSELIDDCSAAELKGTKRGKRERETIRSQCCGPSPISDSQGTVLCSVHGTRPSSRYFGRRAAGNLIRRWLLAGWTGLLGLVHLDGLFGLIRRAGDFGDGDADVIQFVGSSYE
jgi:hypothetical protein